MPEKFRKEPSKTELVVTTQYENANGKGKNVNEFGLTEKQEAFASSFARGFDVVKAYLEAGYADAGSRTENRMRAYRLTVHPGIQNRIEHYKERYAKALSVQDRRLLAELGAVGMFDPADMFDENDQFLPVAKMPEAARRAISEVTRVEKADGEVQWRYRFHDKIKALEIIGQIKGLLRSKQGATARVTVQTGRGGTMTVATQMRSG